MTDILLDHGQLPGSLELAYLGDALFDLRVREALVRKGGRVHAMHREAVAHVCAHAQSEALSRIENMLDEAEQAVVRRARNTRQSPSKNADRAEYCRATALEALIGFLYITGRRERMNQLLDAAIGDI